MKNLKVNGLKNPLGYNMKYQRLSWENIKSEIKFLTIIDDIGNIVFSTEIEPKVNSIELKLELLPRTRYTCKFFNINDEILDRCYFETAKQQEQWSGEWISTDVKQPIFSKNFNVTEISEARLYICAKGIYQIKINNEKITEEVLLPGYYSYDLWYQSNTFNISQYLRLGSNDIEITMTDGWYKGRLGFSGGSINNYGEHLQLIVEVYQNKQEKILVSEKNWCVSKSKIEFSNIYDGEIQNWMQDTEEYSVPEVIKSEKVIEDRMNNQILKHETFIPEIKHLKGNQYLLDFKQNFTGWIEFTSNMEVNQYLKYQVGELLQNDRFYRDNLRTAKAEFHYISDGQKRKVEPIGTFYGFRYALVETDANIDSLGLYARAIYSQMDELGTFDSNNRKINQLYSNVKWGQRSNFLDIPTDCPQRDERLGWTGDAQVFSLTAGLNYNVENFFRNYLYNMRKEQIKYDGIVPLFVPYLRGDVSTLSDGVAGWSDAATIIPWNLYEMYQNKCLLEETYPLMKEWVDYLIDNNQKEGNKYLWTSNFQLGDWLSLDGKSEEVPVGGTDTTFIASIYFYISVLYTAKAASVLSYKETHRYENYAKKIKKELHNEYITKNGKLVVNTQTAYALTIWFDLYESNQKNAIKESLISRLYDDKFEIKTGFIGTPILLGSLEKIGLSEIAIKLFENQKYPGWLYSVNLGATTIWERWNTVLADGTINNQGMNSLNHYAYGSVAHWIYRNLLGLHVDENNKLIMINPNLNTKISNLNGTVHTLNGELIIDICRQNNQSAIKVTIPPGYKIHNKINNKVLSKGENILAVDVEKENIEDLTLLQACTDSDIRSILEEHIPIIFEDESIKRNLNEKLINIRNLISKKRLVPEEGLKIVFKEIRNLN